MIMGIVSDGMREKNTSRLTYCANCSLPTIVPELIISFPKKPLVDDANVKTLIEF